MSDANPNSSPNPNSKLQDPAERIAELESLFAHLERQHEQLNGVVIEQGKLLTRLLKRFDDLDQAMMGQEIDRIHATQQKPPHYLP